MSSPKKVKKSDQAFAIYEKHMHLKDTMKKREFRAIVVAEMSKELDVTNKGTLGMYFAWSEQVVAKRPRKIYSRGDGARARKGAHLDEQTQMELNKLAMGGGMSGGKTKKPAAGLTPSFGAGAFGPRL